MNPSDLENNIKEFINTQKAFNTSIEEKLNKIDDKKFPYSWFKLVDDHTNFLCGIEFCF